VGLYGYPRATPDIDVWVRRSPQNAERIVAAIRDFGFDVPALSAELLLKPDQVIRMGLPSLEDLKRNKAASGRPKDLEDLRHLP
jgi:hypothetical protein